MKQKLYLECTSGISGDMMAAALLDLGADRDALQRALQSIPAEGFSVKISTVLKNGVAACDFLVKLEEAYENHDHDMEYLYGHRKTTGKTDALGQAESVHSHRHNPEQAESAHSHGHGGSGHSHRTLQEVKDILSAVQMTERARQMAEKIFEILAAAEAKAHGTEVEKVHFHEVGAIDSIVDIVTVAVCLDSLGFEKAVIPCLCEGRGTIRCAHGILPVPVPAVRNILEAYRLPVSLLPLEGELVTPTGAAIAAALFETDSLPERFCIRKTGIGAGKRTYAASGILRAMVIEEVQGRREASQKEDDPIIKLETNIDDCTGEILGYVLGLLFEAGALDAFYTPITMKKNRPAVLLTVLCSREKEEELKALLFRETTTIGIRSTKMDRVCLDRRIEEVTLSIGKIYVKSCSYGEETWRYPEYESLAQAAKRCGRPLKEIYEIAVRELM